MERLPQSGVDAAYLWKATCTPNYKSYQTHMETPWKSVIGTRTTFTPELTTTKQLKRDFKINIIKIIKDSK